jgi:hypothetical protein
LRLYRRLEQREIAGKVCGTIETKGNGAIDKYFAVTPAFSAA